MAQDKPTHLSRMLRGPWTGWNNPLLRWDAGQRFLKCLQDLRGPALQRNGNCRNEVPK